MSSRQVGEGKVVLFYTSSTQKHPINYSVEKGDIAYIPCFASEISNHLYHSFC